ncbi:MAG: hypothetical protein NUW37_05750 [Planctomycetes bacterium]|nr:hypothetical protein [Planctomycetota bacterium]
MNQIAIVYNIALVTLKEYLTFRYSFVFVLYFLLLFASIDVVTIGFQSSPTALIWMGTSLALLIVCLQSVFIGSFALHSDVEYRKVSVLLSKPVRRSSYMLGKFLGIATLLFVTSVTCLAILGIFTAGMFGMDETRLAERTLATEVEFPNGSSYNRERKGRTLEYIILENDQRAEYRFDTGKTIQGELAVQFEFALAMNTKVGLFGNLPVKITVLGEKREKTLSKTEIRIRDRQAADFRLRLDNEISGAFWIRIEPLANHAFIGCGEDDVRLVGAKRSQAMTILESSVLIALKSIALLSIVIMFSTIASPFVTLLVGGFSFIVTLAKDFFVNMVEMHKDGGPKIWESGESTGTNYLGQTIDTHHGVIERWANTTKGFIQAFLAMTPDLDSDLVTRTFSLGYTIDLRSFGTECGYYVLVSAIFFAIGAGVFSRKELL